MFEWNVSRAKSYKSEIIHVIRVNDNDDDFANVSTPSSLDDGDIW